MGLAVGPRAHVPVSHNRRVTNVLLIAPLRTETDRRGGRREKERERERLAVMWDDGSTGRRVEERRGNSRYIPGRLEITREEGRMQRPEAANMRFGSPADVHGGCRVVFVARFASLRYLDERNFRLTRHLDACMCDRSEPFEDSRWRVSLNQPR